MSIERLYAEFAVQDMGTALIVHHQGDNVRVADWIEGNKQWALTDAGRALLGEPVTPAPDAPAPAVTTHASRGVMRKPKVVDRNAGVTFD